MIKRLLYVVLFLVLSNLALAQKLLIPMDFAQTDHLKAYGITYWALTQGQTADWLLNYRGGSFMLDYSDILAVECRIRGVLFEAIDGSKAASIYAEVQSNDVNMDVVKLEKAPKIAVYAPSYTSPWDDAVRLALEYAEVKHDIIFDDEVLTGKLQDYDWIHLHHEDFTGQYGKFYRAYSNTAWYIQQVQMNEAIAKRHGYSKVSKLKLEIARKLQEFVASGGFLFAMCSASDSYDIALAADNTDICESMFDGDPADPSANTKLNFTHTFAFENFILEMDPFVYEFSNIDVGQGVANEYSDYFTLFDFSAKYDPVPTMLTQCHVNIVHGFMGQTTAFQKSVIKKSVNILGIREGTEQVKYIQGNIGRGSFCWYGGHDPEDYTHNVGDPPTELKLHKNSPGYRLILNNILFPAAKKKKQKT